MQMCSSAPGARSRQAVPAQPVLAGPGSLKQPVGQQREQEHGRQRGQADPGDGCVRHWLSFGQQLSIAAACDRCLCRGSPSPRGIHHWVRTTSAGRVDPTAASGGSGGNNGRFRLGPAGWPAATSDGWQAETTDAQPGGCAPGANDGAAYADCIRETGFAEYARTPGNRGAWMLRRDQGDRTESITLSLWDSVDAIPAFDGDDIEAAVLYPEDERYLVGGVQRFSVGILRVLQEPHQQRHRRRGDPKSSS